MSLGKKSALVLTEDNKVYFRGYSKDFAFPEDRGESEFKEFKLSQDVNFNDKIVDIAAGRNFNCYVTESGALYCQGNRLLKKFGMESETPLLIPIKDQKKVRRVWASKANMSQELIFIEVEIEEGVRQIWSAGKNEQGLLGHGGKVKESKTFAPLAYDHVAVNF